MLLTYMLQFSMWSHDVISEAILMAEDLKMGQYLKVRSLVPA